MVLQWELYGWDEDQVRPAARLAGPEELLSPRVPCPGASVEGSRVRGVHVPGVLCLSGFSDQWVLVSEGSSVGGDPGPQGFCV